MKTLFLASQITPAEGKKLCPPRLFLPPSLPPSAPPELQAFTYLCICHI
jgi:hypothetical protein